METLITKKTAELAIDKGFTFKFKANNMSYGFDTFEDLEFEDVSQSVLAKWLLDNYKLYINICALGLKKWSFMIEELSIDGTLGRGGHLGVKNYSSFEQAYEEGLFEALNLIK